MTGWWGFALLGLLVPLVVNECSDLGGWMARRLLLWGAKRLGSAAMAERYNEEWLADLERVPGKLTKVGYAFGVVAWGVPRMRWQFARQERRRQLTSGRDAETRGTVRYVPPVNTPHAWEGLNGIERYSICLIESKKGNRRAMATLVEDLTPLVWHTARSNALSRDESEDVVQTVWLALFWNLNAVDDPTDLASWLITTTRQEARLARRDVSDEPAEPDRFDVRDVERNTALWRAFTRLPSRYQEVLRLTVLAGRPDYNVVAEAMRIPPGEVGPAKGGALDTLREFLAEELAVAELCEKDVS
jgi:RNA polymerase sigma factor (sigma-70 family)